MQRETYYYPGPRIPATPVYLGEETPYTPTTTITKPYGERISFKWTAGTEKFLMLLAGSSLEGLKRLSSSTITLTYVFSPATTTSTPPSPWHTSLPLGIAPIHDAQSIPAPTPSGSTDTVQLSLPLPTDTRPELRSYLASWQHAGPPLGDQQLIDMRIHSISIAERNLLAKRGVPLPKSTQ